MQMISYHHSMWKSKAGLGSPLFVARYIPCSSTSRSLAANALGRSAYPILEIIRLFNDRLDIEDRGSVDCFDRAYQ